MRFKKEVQNIIFLVLFNKSFLVSFKVSPGTAGCLDKIPNEHFKKWS